MKHKQALGKLPVAQRNNVKALFKNAKEIAKTTADLHRAYDRRHKLMLRIFDEIDKKPARYFHAPASKSSEPEFVPMTSELAGELRNRYLQAFQPLAISGPGCDDPPVCVNKPGCVCVFGIGTVCCYVCLSPAVIECD